MRKKNSGTIRGKMSKDVSIAFTVHKLDSICVIVFTIASQGQLRHSTAVNIHNIWSIIENVPYNVEPKGIGTM